MRCRVTPNVVSGAVKIEWTSSVSNSPCKATPSACQFGFGVFEVVDFISEMADDRSLLEMPLEDIHIVLQAPDVDMCMRGLGRSRSNAVWPDQATWSGNCTVP